MTIRGITAFAIGGLGLIMLSASADAAISVLGNGPSLTCFQYAEFSSNPADGIETCTFALEETALTPHDRAATLVNRGILRSRLADAQGALRDYDDGLRMDPTLGEGYVDRGAAKIVLKNFDDALADINKGIALNANRLEIAYYDRAIIDEAQGNIKDAYADYKKAVELEPNFALANEQLMRFRVILRKHTDGA